MTDQRLSPDSRFERGASGGSGWRTIVGWVLGVVGGVGVLLGGVILLAGKDEYVGIGGDFSWRVGDIDPVWGAGFLVGGAALVLVGLGLVIVGARAPHAATYDTALRDLLVHAIAFAVVNAFLWAQDIAIGGGLEYAYWVTIPWGIGLAIHALAYYLSVHGQRPGAPQPH